MSWECITREACNESHGHGRRDPNPLVTVIGFLMWGSCLSFVIWGVCEWVFR